MVPDLSDGLLGPLVADRASAPGEGGAASLDERVQTALAGLQSCTFCGLRCGVDRLAGRPAACRLGAETWCFKSYTSYAEDLDLVPALRVYLGGCNFRCRFCNSAPDCFAPRIGRKVEPASVAAEWAAWLDGGGRSIHLLGGEPSLHAHTILQLAAAAGRPLPLALDTNAYMSYQVLDLLAGVIRVYVADFKFGNDRCAERLARVCGYVEQVTGNLLRMAMQSDLRVRHLLMPGHVECCFRPVVEWLSRHLPNVRFRLLTSYVPEWRAASDPLLGRLNGRTEIAAALDYLAASNLDWSTDIDGWREA